MYKQKKLNFGCGKVIKPKKDGWINVDLQKAKGIDKSFDFEKFPYPFDDNTFDYIFSDNVFEHLVPLDKVLQELWRISKNGAEIRFIIPYWNSSGMYQDWTHKNFLNEVGVRNLLQNPGYIHRKKNLFKEVKIKFIQNRLLRWIPVKICWALGKFLNNMIMTMDVTAKVIK